MILCDTNIFLRLAEANSPHRADALRAIKNLRSNAEILCYTPQVIAEFWNVCTRTNAARGGLGLSVETTERKVLLIEKHFVLLLDNAATFAEWRKLVVARQITGIAVHDAKLAASCLAHGVDKLLTFNTSDFNRYPFLTAINPQTV